MTVPAFREPRFTRGRRQAATAARALRAGLARSRALAPVPALDGAALAARLREAGARDVAVVTLAAGRPPWTPTGLRAQPGEEVTWTVRGRARLGLVAIDAPQTFGLRIGDGPIHSSPAASGSAVAGDGGEVVVANLFPGEPCEDGSVALDRTPFRMVRGTWTVVVSVGPPGHHDAAPPSDPPEGWDLHPRLPRSHVHHRCDEGLRTAVDGTVGIVRTPVDVALTETLRVRWSWKVDVLPSALPEDTLLTHDYVSVALEFDDGKDLTWQWSAALPEGFAYTCPLDHWRHREFHVVARSGTGDLGRWVDEERSVLADHRVAIGGSPPGRVVRAWLIGVGIFQGGTGTATYRSFELVDGDAVVATVIRGGRTEGHG